MTTFETTLPVPTRAGQSALGPVHVRVWPALVPDEDDDAAPPARRPVLMALHGWTDSSAVFAPLAAALGRRWTLVAPDAPGHGATPWPHQARYDIPAHARAVRVVLDALPELLGASAPAGVVLYGHSLGGLTAARVAADTALLRHLVLEDPARTTPKRVGSSAGAGKWVAGMQRCGLTACLDLIREREPAWPQEEYKPWARSTLEVDLAHLAVPADWGEPLVAHLADVTCPVTLVRGDPARGGIVSLTAARRCARACRAGCDVVSLDAGHSPRREAREPFLAVLAAVLGRYER